MSARNRNLTEQRDDFLLETNFDDDGALTRAHLNNNRGSSAIPPQPRAYRSNYSIDRYSDAGGYREGQNKAHKTQEHSVVSIRSTNSLSKQHIRELICCCKRCVTVKSNAFNHTHTHFDIIFCLLMDPRWIHVIVVAA